MMKKHLKYSLLTVLSLCLMVLFAACDQHPNMNVDQINADKKPSLSPAVLLFSRRKSLPMASGYSS